MEKISIIVPVYNVEKYLEKTLNALLAQSFKNLEIILVDDGSTDKSGIICDEYAAKDKRIIVLHKKNAGVSNARNCGIEIASGKYIGFCDSDDEPMNDLYETLYNMICSYHAEIVSAQTLIIYEDGSTYTQAKNKGVTIWNNKSDSIKAFFKGTFGMAVYKMLFLKSLIKNISFNETLKINEDKKFLFDTLIQANRVAYLDEAKYRYYRRQNSLSCSQFGKKYLDVIVVADLINTIIKHKFPELRNYAEADLIKAHLSVLKLLLIAEGKSSFQGQWEQSVTFLKNQNYGFCKKYLDHNSFIKWLILKIGVKPFEIMIKRFCRN